MSKRLLGKKPIEYDQSLIRTLIGTTEGGSAAVAGDATYLCLSSHGNLTAERLFKPGSHLAATDGGAEGDYDIDVDVAAAFDWTNTHSFPDIKTKGPYSDVRSYSSFSNAIDTIGANAKTLLISSQQNVTDDKTVPSNVTLWFLQGGSLNISNTKVVTINGNVQAGLYQIFEGDGIVTFGVGACAVVYPQWWGAVGDGATDDEPAIMAACNSLSDAAQDTGGTVFFPPGVYHLETALALGANHKSMTLVGAAPARRTGYEHGATLWAATGQDCIQITSGGVDLHLHLMLRIQNLGIYANNGDGIDLDDVGQVFIEWNRISVRKNYRAIDLGSNWGGSIYIVGNEIFSRGGLSGGTAIRALDLWDSFILDNHIGQPGYYGMDLGGGDCLVRGNKIYIAHDIGLRVAGFQNRIIENHVNESGKHGITISGVRNTVVGNTCVNNDQQDLGNNGIQITGDFNTITGNVCTDKQAVETQDYGIGLSGTSENNVVLGNICWGNVVGGINDNGTDNEVAHNIVS